MTCRYGVRRYAYPRVRFRAAAEERIYLINKIIEQSCRGKYVQYIQRAYKLFDWARNRVRKLRYNGREGIRTGELWNLS